MHVFLVVILKFKIVKNVINTLKRLKDIKRKQQILRILLLVKRANLL